MIDCLLFTFLVFGCAVTTVVSNDRPVIGILSQELPTSLEQEYGNYTSFIAASYVKFVETGGARVVPVLLFQSSSYYDKLFASLNGVLFPGGAVSITDSGYAYAGQFFYDQAVKYFDEGDYFPIWGACLGFELLTRLATGDVWLNKCNSYDEAKPLHFTKDFLTSRMFHSAPDEIIRILAEEEVTVNYHHKCMTPTNFSMSAMASSYYYMSTNQDDYNTTFISTLEGRQLPFFGVQFHPEKNIFEWSLKKKAIPHTSDAVLIAQYFADFFVDQARCSQHKFKSEGELEDYLIDNYKPEFTAKTSSYYQCYFF